MIIILQQIKKWKILVFILVSLLYSISGITTSIILKAAGKLSNGTITNILIFGAGSIALYLFVYTVMYINNILMMSIIRDFNITLTRKALQCYAQKKIKMKDSEVSSFLSQDLFLFWQEYLSRIFVIPTWSLVILVSICFMLLQNVFLGILFSIGGIIMIFPQLLLNRRLEKAGNNYSEAKEKNLEKLTDYTRNISMFRNNNAERDGLIQTMEAVKRTEQAQFRFFTTHNLTMFWTGPFRGVGEVIPFIIGLIMIQQGYGISFPVLIALFTASQQLKSPLQQVLSAFSSIQSVKGIKNKVIEILLIPDDELDLVQKITGFDRLCISNLTFKFDNRTIFQNANLAINSGEKVLLTGKSGVGKSTLFKLLVGQIEGYEGSIYLENQNDFPVHNFTKEVAMIQQTPVVFHGTVRDNLGLFQSFSDEEMIESLKQVGLYEVLPNVLDFNLTGDNLSGGQTMRLEIARAILRKKQIILADEITAALDHESGVEIRDLLLSLPQTIIEIAHYYDIDNYDRVVVLEKTGFTFSGKYSEKKDQGEYRIMTEPLTLDPTINIG